MKVCIIGGGAAGFFAALTCARSHSGASIHILEKSSKLLSKVRISGGGRCNVTHDCHNRIDLSKQYPRGGNFLKEIFKEWMPADMLGWFRERGVKLKTEADGRIFPVTDSSETIIRCFLNESKKSGIQIQLNTDVREMTPLQQGGFRLNMYQKEPIVCDKVIVTTGGSPSEKGLDWLRKLGHRIEKPVPSLFTFNIPKEPLLSLQGISLNNAQVSIPQTTLSEKGPLLITHWGLSGPSVLRLSAWGARELASTNYQFQVRINWLPDFNEAQLREYFMKNKVQHASKITGNVYPVPKRLWLYLLKRCGVPESKKWAEVSKAEINRLCAITGNDLYQVSGKTTFKEEFVTCGGINLQDVSARSMQSKIIPHLYFAGEVLDIDGITGGFNFQSAWSTAYIVGQLREER